MLASDTKNALVDRRSVEQRRAQARAVAQERFLSKWNGQRRLSVTFPVATNSWKIVQDTESGDWKFAEAKPEEKLDSAKASGVSNPFSSPMFTTCFPSPRSNGLDQAHSGDRRYFR